MKKFFKEQHEFQQQMGQQYDQQYINIMMLSMIDETMEALRETPWKPWKKSQQFNKKEFCEELVDMQIFLTNLFLAAGMTSEEVEEACLRKLEKNKQRQKNNY
jgi:NTP pyrophosphatase (non-canonical NTP hydrolase)